MMSTQPVEIRGGAVPGGWPAGRRAPLRWRTSAGDPGYLLGRSSCALAIFAALLASTTPSPLYPVYIRQLGLDQSAGTTIFSIYAVGTLLALFLSPRLDRRVSDRRQTLLPALLVTAAGAVIFALADSMWMLMLGRLLSGLSTGMITSTASAALFDLDTPEKRGRAATVSTVAFTGGAAFGPCLASAALAAGVAPLVTPFACIALVAAIAFVGLACAAWPKRAAPVPAPAIGAAAAPASARQGLRLFRLACLSVGVAWMLGSMLMALGVSVATDLFGLQVQALAGLMPALFQLSGGIGQVLASRFRALDAILFGTLGLALLQILAALGALAGVPLVFVLAMPLCGLCYGAAFVGGAALVNETAPPGQHAARISRFYVVGYLANAIPTFLLGFLIDGIGLGPAFYVFSAVLSTVAFLAAGIARSRRRG
ncbi:MFS transporter [Oceanicella sp. SM1341]|uniref:MFS transporter n=1 Tax=Oceanicella sp. SM1341 TaxID=1548889 RepID=UPI0013007A8D|nr:MFS transporter [Oceanicella sp. SM1341]